MARPSEPAITYGIIQFVHSECGIENVELHPGLDKIHSRRTNALASGGAGPIRKRIHTHQFELGCTVHFPKPPYNHRDMSSLAIELFREIRPGLFRVLAGSNARTYVDVLDAL